MFTKRFWTVMAPLALGVLALAACAPREVIVTEEVIVTQEVVVTQEVIVTQEVVVTEVVTEEIEVEVPAKILTFDSELFSAPAEQQFFINEILADFEEETGITVNFTIVQDQDKLDRITVQQETGHVTTDVILAFNGRFPWYTDVGYVSSLDEVADIFEGRTILPAFDVTAIVDGTRYFVPISSDVYLTVANNNALDYLPAGAEMDTLTY